MFWCLLSLSFYYAYVYQESVFNYPYVSTILSHWIKMVWSLRSHVMGKPAFHQINKLKHFGLPLLALHPKFLLLSYCVAHSLLSLQFLSYFSIFALKWTLSHFLTIHIIISRLSYAADFLEAWRKIP